MPDTEDDYLFPLAELKTLLNKSSSDGAKYDQVTATLLQRNLLLRPLRLDDHSKGYMELLGQHTTAGDVSYEKFTAQFRRMQAYRDVYYIVVIEDTTTQKIVATGTLEVELKFIHSAALRGRLEEVVIDAEDEKYRYTEGNLAVIILDVLTTLGRVLGCYKISLESEDHLLQFYNKFGYEHVVGQKYMVVRYKN